MRAAPAPTRPASRLGVVLLALLAWPAGAESETSALRLAVQTPVFAGAELAVELRQAGALAGRPLAVQLVVDGVSVGRFETTGETTILRARPERLSAGRHVIGVKSGSLRAEQSVRVWPAWMPGAAVGALLLFGLGGFAAVRRRRSHPVTPVRS